MKKNSEELNRFPDFIGTQEYVENGERFVYETGWDPDAGTVGYTKYDERRRSVYVQCQRGHGRGNFGGAGGMTKRA